MGKQTMIIKSLFALLISIISLPHSAFAVTTFTLTQTKDTADHGRSQVDGSNSVLGLISLINDYIWFFIGFFCFIFMIRNGYKLISANGDEKAMKAAKTGLLWSIIWLAICLLAYIIVNIAVRLFAQ